MSPALVPRSGAFGSSSQSATLPGTVKAVTVMPRGRPARVANVGAHRCMASDRRVDECGIEHIEDAVAGQHVQNPLMPVEGKRLTLAQIEQAGDMIDIGIGQDDRGDRAGAQRIVRRGMQLPIVVDLLAQVGRGVEQDPMLSIGADGNRGLGLGTALWRSPARARRASGRCCSTAETRRPPPRQAPESARFTETAMKGTGPPAAFADGPVCRQR